MCTASASKRPAADSDETRRERTARTPFLRFSVFQIGVQICVQIRVVRPESSHAVAVQIRNPVAFVQEYLGGSWPKCVSSVWGASP